MLQKITMPPGGQNTDQLTVVKWHKQEGDAVKRGDVLMEIETDKATLEAESFAQGTLLKVLVIEGETAFVGDVVAYVGEEGDLAELVSEPEQSMGEPIEEDDYQSIMPSATKATSEAPVDMEVINERMKASPAAKKAARDMNLDINKVFKLVGKPVLKREDILEYANTAFQTPTETTGTQKVDYEIIPITNMRRIIAARMEQSAFTVPTFTVEIEVDVEACMDLRVELNKRAEGIRIAYHDIMAKCIAAVVKKHPLVNASFGEDGIRVHKSVNMGLAVSLENGLLVPVVRDVGNKSLSAIAKENAENIVKAREGKLSPADMEGGTITISNLGMFPVSRFTAIINPPQSCILAVGGIIKRPVWMDDGWAARSMMSITASFDHRVVDGAYGAAFLGDLKELIEHPAMLLL